jgi:hypothetical protein
MDNRPSCHIDFWVSPFKKARSYRWNGGNRGGVVLRRDCDERLEVAELDSVLVLGIRPEQAWLNGRVY